MGVPSEKRSLFAFSRTDLSRLAERSDRFFSRTGFFWVLFFTVAMKMALSFRSEFPALTLLCKWDCGWYESIARQGYRSPVPPIFQNSEESNVAFFPAYPMLGRTLAKILGIPLQAALPLLSIVCAFFVSILLSRLIERESALSQRIRWTILLAYPATFYLLVSYSEALYLLGTFGVLGFAFGLFGNGASLSALREPSSVLRRGLVGLLLVAPFLFGYLLGTTRLTGFIVPSFVALGALVYSLPAFRSGLRRILDEARAKRTLLPAIGAAFGIGTFFLFCALRFGHWNMYFQQLKIGWYKEFSPLRAAFIAFNPPPGFELSIPALVGNTRVVSWMIVDTVALVGGYAVVRAAGSAHRFFRERNLSEFLRCFVVFGAFVHFLIVVCGDVGPWDYWGNGMRYSMPTVYLLALLWRDEWTPRLVREKRVLRWGVVGLIYILAIVSFGLEVEYIGRFIRNEWVS